MDEKTRLYMTRERLQKSLDMIENYGGKGVLMPISTICDTGYKMMQLGKYPLIEKDAWRFFCGAVYPHDHKPVVTPVTARR